MCVRKREEVTSSWVKLCSESHPLSVFFFLQSHIFLILVEQFIGNNSAKKRNQDSSTLCIPPPLLLRSQVESVAADVHSIVKKQVSWPGANICSFNTNFMDPLQRAYRWPAAAQEYIKLWSEADMHCPMIVDNIQTLCRVKSLLSAIRSIKATGWMKCTLGSAILRPHRGLLSAGSCFHDVTARHWKPGGSKSREQLIKLLLISINSEITVNNLLMGIYRR